MIANKNWLPEPIPAGTKVRIKHTRVPRAEVREYVGPFGGGGTRAYRVQIMWKPYRDFLVVREDQLEIVEDSAEGSVAPVPSPAVTAAPHAPATQAP